MIALTKGSKSIVAAWAAAWLIPKVQEKFGITLTTDDVLYICAAGATAFRLVSDGPAFGGIRDWFKDRDAETRRIAQEEIHRFLKEGIRK